VALAGLLGIAYLLGAFPTAVIVGRLVRGIDIREHGSRNAGATNVWRVLGWKAGLVVLGVDLAKGALAAAGVSRLPLRPAGIGCDLLPLLCGLAAVLGHSFPVYTRFRGGKGVATGAGMLLAAAPLPSGIALGVFAVAVVATGYVSLGSLLGAIAVPLSVVLLERYALARYPTPLLVFTAALAAFILIMHRKNVVRLIQGTERRFPQLQVWKRLRPDG
jgi:glycerol-3-phosphate acyltransferase PlsY